MFNVKTTMLYLSIEFLSRKCGWLRERKWGFHCLCAIVKNWQITIQTQFIHKYCIYDILLGAMHYLCMFALMLNVGILSCNIYGVVAMQIYQVSLFVECKRQMIKHCLCRRYMHKIMKFILYLYLSGAKWSHQTYHRQWHSVVSFRNCWNKCQVCEHFECL